MKVRVISALVALVIAIVVLALAHTWVFYLAIAALSVGALYELFKAMGLIKFPVECCICFGYAAFDILIEMVHGYNILGGLNGRLYGLVFVSLILLMYLKDYSKYVYSVPFTLVGLTLGVSWAFRSLALMPTMFPKFGVFAIVLTLAGAWLADSGAYFAGTFFGKHKLAPVISPKKTIEGVIGGTVVNGVLLLIVAGVYGAFINKQVDMHYPTIFIMGMLCSPIGLLGDLAASVIKRQAQIKDYGNIMPGHGGIMDRFDSVMTVAPFMYWLFSIGALITIK
ncbi:MAG: phosphatidate cytidylyltransferase [Ruminococcus sp.]|nr:phosphatidate cytidylyltransferase [Ruminococcus sp.]